MTRRTPKPKHFSFLRQAALLLAVFGLLIGVLRAGDGTPGTGGTIITNRAEARYEDGSGTTYQTVSETVMITVARVPAINVTPDETAPSAATAPNERITRLFQICNTGNSPDSFLATRSINRSSTCSYQFFVDSKTSGGVRSGDCAWHPVKMLCLLRG